MREDGSSFGILEVVKVFHGYAEVWQICRKNECEEENCMEFMWLLCYVCNKCITVSS